MRVKEIKPKQPLPSHDPTPNHWVDLNHTAFRNPWSSWRSVTIKDGLYFLSQIRKFPSVSTATSRLIPIHKPTWGLGDGKGDISKGQIKATWLGHACFFVELPSRSELGTRGARILFDPVFSDRCSPTQWLGPKRYTAPPCKIEEIPEVDAIVISHNHYDHLDTRTIQELSQRPRVPHFFAPLGNGPYFRSLGIPDSNIHIMDWWDSKRLEVELDSDPSQHISVDITCTPAQHFTGRGLFDRFKTLWSSWAIEEVRSASDRDEDRSSSGTQDDLRGVKLYFAGDTGYRSVMDGQDEEKVPVCPAFKEIGDRFGGFDLAMIPIGAYLPRQFMSPIHCAPQDSVQLFKDVKAKKALGMHWGTWVLTTEDVMEPPRRLAEECKKEGIEDGAFRVCEIGETLFF